MLEINSCSWSRGVLEVAVSPVVDWKADDEIVETAEVDVGVLEHVFCFGSVGMQMRLLTWKMGALSSRAFEIARRLPWLLMSRRKSLRTVSCPGQAFIKGQSPGLSPVVLSVQATRSCVSLSSTISLWKGFGGFDASGSECGGVEHLKQYPFGRRTRSMGLTSRI